MIAGAAFCVGFEREEGESWQEHKGWVSEEGFEERSVADGDDSGDQTRQGD